MRGNACWHRPVTCKSRLGVAEREEGVDDDREERGKPRDLGYVGVGYLGYVHSHMMPG